MRTRGDARGDARSSALWGTGARGGESRSNALWGKGGRGIAVALVGCLTLALPMAARAGHTAPGKTYVAPGVLQAAAENPAGKLRVIIQSEGGGVAAGRATQMAGGRTDRTLESIGGVVAELPARAVAALAASHGLTVTLDAPVRVAEYTSSQLWPHQNGVSRLWGTDAQPAPRAPTIAIVDSGIDNLSPDFGSRIVRRQVITTLPQNPLMLDSRGHGTFVAGIAAGAAPGLAGAAPTANLVDLDVMNDAGMARTSDVVAACDWILANKDVLDIRVANFSLHSTSVLSVRYHPLNRAVERLWFSGVVVVAAAGNYGVTGGPSGVRYAPGNDPFVVTVGALDIGGTARLGDDGVPSWSAFGYTLEGFAKPEVVAAGRYMVGPVPAGATLTAEKPDKVVGLNRMQLSGTSFAAPVVSGIAAQMLARNSSLTPDQVKGALMKTARRVPEAPLLAQGRGEVNAVRAAGANNVPNGNGALSTFVVSDPGGGSGRVWDASAWYDAIRGNSAWDTSAWSDSAWTDSAWSDSAWADSAWSDSAWSDSAWSDSAWSDGLTYEDNAEGETGSSLQVLTPGEALELASDPDLSLP